MTRTCGCLGCSDRATVKIDHPEHGRMVVCDDHKANFRIYGFVAGGGEV